jgi:hypothetical protein
MKTFYLRFIGLFSAFLVILPALAFLPGTASADAGTFKTDNFNACTMNSSLWTFSDPLGGATTKMNGTAVSIIIPQGIDHDIWTDGTTLSINAPRFMQSATNTDFKLQVKMDSPFLSAAKYQTQGILVQQDGTRLLRFEFYGDGANVFVLAVEFSKNSTTGVVSKSTMVQQSIGSVTAIAHMYMRVQRAGSTWTQTYSTDGTNWLSVFLKNTPSASTFNFPMNVSSIGFYGGNTVLDAPPTTAPAHTAVFDYFYNMDDGTQPGDKDFNTLKIDPITGTGTVNVSPQKTNYDCGEKVTLTAQPGAGWTFTKWTGGFAGSTSPVDMTMNGSTIVGAIFTQEGTGNPTKLFYLPIVSH